MKLLLKAWKHIPFSKNLRTLFLRIVNDQFLIGVTGVIFNSNNKILLLKHTYRKTAWSLPGGYLQAKEHPREGLVREIKEETGFKVTVIKHLKTRTTRQGRIDICYFGKYQSGKFKKSDEVTKYKFVSATHLPKLIDDQYEQIEEALESKKEHDFRKNIQIVKNFVPTLLKKLFLV
jgi:ADP-ribose pyrophosphatase YjhB (NUDIX family)